MCSKITTVLDNLVITKKLMKWMPEMLMHVLQPVIISVIVSVMLMNHYE